MKLAEELAARTLRLCAIPSEIGHEEAIAAEVEGWARRGAFAEVRRVRNSLVVGVDSALSPALPRPAGEGVRGRPVVALCGHLDTIPVPAPDRGRAPRREGGRIVATGASDMKGGLAVMMSLAERLPRPARSCDLVLVLYAREEGPFAENELGDVLAEVPGVAAADLALCLEPTDNALQLGCVGSIHATFEFAGRSAHSARPWQGENAVHKAWALLQHLASRPPREVSSGGLAYREVMSATRIEGGHARNAVPERCRVNVNFRIGPDKALDAALRELEALAERFGASCHPTDLSPSCPAFAEHPLVQRLAALTGAPPEAKQAWTDVARLAQAGVPAVNFGPGAPAQAHQAGEWIAVEALARSHALLERFLAP